MNPASEKKVLMLGLDSTDIGYLQAYLPALTNFRRLFASGRLLPLQTTAEVMDASVWPTFSLARLPGDHGMYFPFQWDPECMKFRRLAPGWLPFEPFWHELGARGIPVGLLDVPMVPLPSASVPNVTHYHWQSQDEGNAVKHDSNIERRFGKSPLRYDIAADKTRPQLRNLRRDCIHSVQKRCEIGQALIQETDWRLLLVCFSELHRAGHYLCPQSLPHSGTYGEDDQLLGVYQALDEAIGRLTNGLDFETTSLVIFSLHGMGPNNTQTHFVPEILDRLNNLPKANGGNPDRKQHSVMRRLRETLPGQVQHQVAMLVPQAARDWVINRAFSGGFDWHNTPAFTVASGGQGYIRCNLKGREQHGCLEPGSAAHRDYLDLLRDTFLSLRVSGTNQRLVKKIVENEKTFPGPMSHLLPDLAIIWEDIPPAQTIHSEKLGTIGAKLRTGRCGNHRPGAFALVVSGNGAAERADIPNHIVGLSRYVEHLLMH